MYAAIYAVLLILAGLIAFWGVRRKSVPLVVAGPVLAVLTVLFFWFLSFWGEALWFEQIGFGARFWKEIAAKVLLACGGGLVGGLVVFGLTLPLGFRRPLKILGILLGTYIAAQGALISWDKVLLLIHRAPTEVTDPILNRSLGFYFFVLPVYDTLNGILLLLTVLALIVSAAAMFVRVGEHGLDVGPTGPQPLGRRALLISAGAVLLVLAWGRYLERFHLLYSPYGVVSGPGWTDVHVRLPMYWVVAILLALLGLALAIGPAANRALALVGRLRIRPEFRPVGLVLSAGALAAGLWAILLALIPAAFQWLVVQPNEITRERPYIEYNIAFTRKAFDLEKIEQRRFPVSDRFTRDMVADNPDIFRNIRLWDWRALDAVYKQFQEIRLYYEFADVDIDRYTYDDKYRSVMISARELELGNLPGESRTFVNRRFKYTHGFGITLAPVSEFTNQGLPNMLVKNIPPVSEFDALKVDQPRIYYGELTDTHVIVNSSEAELDYPQGEDNVYIHYDGTGGVPVGNFRRKFLFGYKFDGTELLLSGYPRAGSRIMFHRNIRDRVRTVAPFLHLDADPYIVLAGGRLYWIVDAYAVSSDYPYSEPFGARAFGQVSRGADVFAGSRTRRRMQGVNYIRNSVKAVVDAYNGDITLYVFEPDDPLIRTWRNVFGDLFRDRDQMPKALQAHIRYPSDLLQVQGLIYAKYHMTDPTVFYNQEDLWVQATETYYGQTRLVEPYYIMWEPPGSDDAEFILMLPFTPKNKQVLIGWMAGMCDPENYGRLLAYKFPKEKRVLGTQQVETKIDQDPTLSARLSLWDQRGSRVIRGNVLAIPVEDTLLYVEPIYLQAETAAYPELRLVVVMHDDVISYAPNFEEALESLLSRRRPRLEPGPETQATVPSADETQQALIRQAADAFDAYLGALGARDFDGASEQLETLSEALNRLSGSAAGQGRGDGQDDTLRELP